MTGILARMAILTFSITTVQAKRLAEVDLSRIEETSHIEIQSDQAWNYDVKDLSQSKTPSIRLMIDPISSESEQRLLTYSDKLIKGIRVDNQGPNGRYILHFDLRASTTSVFHYLSDKPTRLILDFYVDEVKVAKTKKRARKKGRSLSSVDIDLESKKFKSLPKGEQDRLRQLVEAQNQRRRLSQDFLLRPLDIEDPNFDLGSLPDLITPDRPSRESKLGIFDGGDPQFRRFNIKEEDIDQNSMISSRQNIYLPFPMLEIDLKYIEVLQANLPIYKIRPKKTEENRVARLLLKLFRKNRQATFSHTSKLFREKYPNSEYAEIVAFMEADMAYKAYMKERTPANLEIAMDRYTIALHNHPKSTLAERIALLKGFTRLKMKNSLEALSIFGEYLRRYPESGKKEEVRLAQASAFLHLRRYEDALGIYNNLIKKKATAQYAQEARYRLGDVYFHKKEYQQAVKEYQQAFNKFPKAWHSFPNAFYNSGEALFWLGEYKKSLDFFREFLRRFPDNKNAGYAMTRVGELLEVMGAEKERVVGAFLETRFRYGNDPGADVAQLRLLSHRMLKMKDAELEKNLAQMYEIGMKSYLQGMNQFVTVMIADGFRARGEYDKAISTLDNFFRQNPTVANRELIAQRVTDNVAKKIRLFVENQGFLEALKTYDKMKENWIRNHNRTDIPYFVGKAYEQAGVYDKAAEFYGKALVASKKAREDEAGLRIRKVFEYVPTLSSLNLRIGTALLKNSKLSEAGKALKKIDVAGLTESERVEKILASSELAEKLGMKKRAIELLTEFIDDWKGSSKTLMPSLLRRGTLQVKSQNLAAAEKDFRKVIEYGEAHEGFDIKSQSRAMEELGKILLNKGEREQAFAIWNQMIEKFEKKVPVAAVRYKAGQILFKEEKIREAVEYWEKLKFEKNPFWYNLAQEQIKNSKWRTDYKKYIKRIPAMAGGKAENDVQ